MRTGGVLSLASCGVVVTVSHIAADNPEMESALSNGRRKIRKINVLKVQPLSTFPGETK